jgi:hypothetical protein
MPRRDNSRTCLALPRRQAGIPVHADQTGADEQRASVGPRSEPVLLLHPRKGSSEALTARIHAAEQRDRPYPCAAPLPEPSFRSCPPVTGAAVACSDAHRCATAECATVTDRRWSPTQRRANRPWHASCPLKPSCAAARCAAAAPTARPRPANSGGPFAVRGVLVNAVRAKTLRGCSDPDGVFNARRADLLVPTFHATAEPTGSEMQASLVLVASVVSPVTSSAARPHRPDARGRLLAERSDQSLHLGRARARPSTSVTALCRSPPEPRPLSGGQTMHRESLGRACRRPPEPRTMAAGAGRRSAGNSASGSQLLLSILRVSQHRQPEVQ